MAETYDVTADGSAVCRTCGAVAGDRGRHDAWHQQLRIACGQPVPARDIQPGQAGRPAI